MNYSDTRHAGHCFHGIINIVNGKSFRISLDKLFEGNFICYLIIWHQKWNTIRYILKISSSKEVVSLNHVLKQNYTNLNSTWNWVMERVKIQSKKKEMNIKNTEMNSADPFLHDRITWHTADYLDRVKLLFNVFNITKKTEMLWKLLVKSPFYLTGQLYEWEITPNEFS